MLVVGLGNPGERYAGSPHNVGFRVLEQFAEHMGQVAWSNRFRGRFALTAVGGEKVALLEPQTYMNRSGESVREAMAFFKIPQESTLVVHDELDLPLGALKLKRGGGEAGHNGLRSVSKELATRDYWRLRVGVGRPSEGQVVDFLLSPLSRAESEQLDAAVAAASQAIDLVLRQGFARAMNQVNRRAEAPQPKPSTEPGEAGIAAGADAARPPKSMN